LWLITSRWVRGPFSVQQWLLCWPLFTHVSPQPSFPCLWHSVWQLISSDFFINEGTICHFLPTHYY
jgi:hypothetical protein